MKPKKSLGQNFLRDRKVLEQIIKSANLKLDDLVLEVGPGEGVLTEELVKRAGKVVVIEIDKNLAKKLNNKFRDNKKIAVINGDILKINLPEILDSEGSTSGVAPKVEPSALGITALNYKVIANIPYYITSPIIQLFLETKIPPTEMILMVQKEVAERICAKPGEMSILAVSVQYYASAEILFYVNKKSFWPAPEVDSAVIRITPNPSAPSGHLPLKKEERIEERKKFFRVVRAGFSAKRKTLLNNLANSFHLEKSAAEEKIKKAGIDPTSRAQELSVEDWVKISKIFL